MSLFDFLSLLRSFLSCAASRPEPSFASSSSSLDGGGGDDDPRALWNGPVSSVPSFSLRNNFSKSRFCCQAMPLGSFWFCCMPMPSMSSFCDTLSALVRPSPDAPRPLEASQPNFSRYVCPKRLASGSKWVILRQSDRNVRSPSAHERLRGSFPIRCLTFLPESPIDGRLQCQNLF